MKIWIGMFIVLGLGLVGCSANQDKAKAHQENLESVKVLANFMRDNNMVGSIHVTISGDGSVYAKQSFGLDTGINVQANIQFDPQNTLNTNPILPDPK